MLHARRFARRFALGLLVLLLPHLARADELPATKIARRELVAGMALTGFTVGAELLCGLFVGTSDHLQGDTQDQVWRAGLGFGLAGAIVGPGAFTTLTYGAAHYRALRRFELSDDADARTAATLLARLDDTDRVAHARERAGQILFGVGTGLAIGGALLGIFGGLAGVQFNDESGSSTGGNSAALLTGIALGTLGDGALLTGWFMWTEAAATRRGLREARRSLSLTASGVRGTF